jgi:hypothetical protein
MAYGFLFTTFNNFCLQQMTKDQVKEQHVFWLHMMIEGATEKVLQFQMLLKSIYSQNLCYNEQKCIFEHCKKVKTINFITTL